MAITAKTGKRNTWTVNVGAYNGGTKDHSKLFNRDADDQHPMGAITGLETFSKNTKAHMASKENPHGVTAAQVGARPDTWMPTAAQVGASPSGYGLGTGGVFVTDCNKAIKPGFYATTESTINRPDWYIAAYSAMLVTERQGEIYQRLFMNAIYGYTEIVRYSGDGGTTWSEWEWVNPLMIPGAEYRTTERWNGKAVYRKIIDVKAVGSGTNTITDEYSSSVTNVIRYCGSIGTNALPLPEYSTWLRVGMYNGQLSVVVNVGESAFVGQNVYAEAWYTKD